jgi:hypothetical protein
MKELEKFALEMLTIGTLRNYHAEVEFKYARVKLNKFHECKTYMIEIGLESGKNINFCSENYGKINCVLRAVCALSRNDVKENKV